MPKILSRQPRWLDHSTASRDFFLVNGKDKLTTEETTRDAPYRRIAQRGTEVFAVVGNELRWTDLGILKEAGEENGGRYGRPGEPNKQPVYQVLKTPAARPILQLSVSPSGDFIAVLTSHTCHVCLLPPREHLNFYDSQPVKLRSFHVGPTAHVLEQSPLVSAVWHPLSPAGNALVTVTKDACVRLWELDHNNRSTFNEPALAVDLKKLKNATSAREDLGASRYGTSNGFSPDQVEMQVASSCFGGQGREDEDGWSSMTLWVAMTEGNVYALCPFLPSQFWTPATLLPSLSTSVVSKKRVIEQDREVTELEKLVINQQSAWLTDLDEQDATIIEGATVMEVYSRPSNLSPIPRLQGPFEVTPEPEFGGITDIHVIAPKTNDESLFDDQEDLDWLGTEDGLSIGVICLATDTSKVHVCLNVEGVEAEWLPKRSRAQNLYEMDAVKDLLLFETLDFPRGDQTTSDAWPTFTPSPTDRYQLFSGQPTGVYSMSFRPWISGLESELADPGAAQEGVGFRLNILLESARTDVETMTSDFDRAYPDMSAAIAVLGEADVGYVLLTSAPEQPFAVVLEVPSATSHPFAPDSVAPESVFSPESRAAYRPADVLFQETALPAQLEAWRRESATGASGDVRGQIRFSPYTLQKITEAHRLLSSETHNLGIAAADLFRRCERMVSEMKAQVEKVKELSNRIDSVTGENEFPEQAEGSPELVRGGRGKIQNRIQARQDKTVQLRERVEGLRKKMRQLGGRELSAKERAFAEEVDRLEQSIPPARAAAPTSPTAIVKMENSEITTTTESQSDAGGDPAYSLAARFRAAQEVYARLMQQADDAQKQLQQAQGGAQEESASRPTTAGGSHAAAADYRQQKLAYVFDLLERETALVDAVGERLEKLQVAAR
ncbi:Nucleoporin NUP82 [Lecanosticta acicola]|uniref:Nucleoporin NUP82 n=1 Tax=Lecanosticta acicola TaxID=111012 RepID=A0AAI9EBG3_9PEZI|nr:Nucleoporin NUP82 [Lecanosticta acicola]